MGGKGAEEIEGGERVSALGPDRERILEGVVPLAVRALSSQHAAVPPLAVRCLAQLSTMRLGAFDSSTGALARRIMALLRECPRANAQLSQDCLKLLNNLLKRHAAFTPTDAQFRFIISFAFGDLEVRCFLTFLSFPLFLFCFPQRGAQPILRTDRVASTRLTSLFVLSRLTQARWLRVLRLNLWRLS